MYDEWGADIVFAGHTHGGMIRLFDHGLISTDRTFFPKYDGGFYYIDDNNVTEEKNKEEYLYYDNNMIVSRGLSRGHIGFRLFNRPELVVVEFN